MVVDLIYHHNIKLTFFQVINKLQSTKPTTYHYNFLFHNLNDLIFMKTVTIRKSCKIGIKKSATNHSRRFLNV